MASVYRSVKYRTNLWLSTTVALLPIFLRYLFSFLLNLQDNLNTLLAARGVFVVYISFEFDRYIRHYQYFYFGHKTQLPWSSARRIFDFQCALFSSWNALTQFRRRPRVNRLFRRWISVNRSISSGCKLEHRSNYSWPHWSQCVHFLERFARAKWLHHDQQCGCHWRDHWCNQS